MSQRDIYRGLSVWNWFKAIRRGPRATARRAGRVVLGRASARAIRRLLPPERSKP